MDWNDYAVYKKKCITWGVIIAIIWGAWMGFLGFGMMGAGTFSVMGLFMTIFGIAFGFMGGFAFGGALYVSKFDKPLTFVQKIFMFFICLILSPIFFIIRLVDINRVKKQLVEEDR